MSQAINKQLFQSQEADEMDMPSIPASVILQLFLLQNPFPLGDKFAVHFKLDATEKKTDCRMKKTRNYKRAFQKAPHQEH